MRDANGDGQLDDHKEEHDASGVPGVLGDQRAGGLLLAFLAAVIVLLAVGTMPLSPREGASPHSSTGNGVPAHTTVQR